MQHTIEIIPVEHASFITKWQGVTTYHDPVGTPAQYLVHGAPDLIVITHHHPDHLDILLLEAIAVEIPMIVPQVVAERLPTNLTTHLTVMANNETITHSGMTVSAVPMYNQTEGRTAYHVKGVGNGYVISYGDVRLYNASDTEATPEFLQQTNIDVLFVPMNLPFTMSVEEAAEATLALAPKQVYPYHYRDLEGNFSDVGQFRMMVEARNPAISVVEVDWYPVR